MLLKRLEIFGFKSFADKIVIEFDRGITSIVGPNGSGKSNVADAINWVLGEQSAKTLRGSKMEDIIFSGTESRKPLGFAEVSLTLDNSNEVLPIEYTEVTVTRRVYRSGGSEYLINRNACRLKDINELLMDTGLGKSGYSIIGQGKIDEILSVNPESRRNVFEEAAGIMKYKTRKLESERKLINTEKNIDRVEDILNEIEQQLGPLELQSETAKKYLILRDELKAHELNLFVREYDNSKKREDQYNSRINAINDKLLAIKEETITKEDIVKKFNFEIEKKENELDLTREERFSLINKKERTKGKIGIIKERLEQLNNENDRLKNENKKNMDYLQERDAQIERTKALREEKNSDEIKLNKEIEDLNFEFESLQKDINLYHKKAQDERTRLYELMNALSLENNEITKLKTISDNYNLKLSEIEINIREIESLYEENLKQYNTLKEEEEYLLTIEAEKDKDRDNLLKKITDASVNLDNEIKRNSYLKSELNDVLNRLKLIEDMIRNYEGFNRTVKEVLLKSQRDEALSSRLIGLVADLITVDERYEKAIEIALGPSMQYIVTPKEEDAKYIIDYLRKDGLGRATFLPLTSIKSRYLSALEREALTMQGAIGIASDIIVYDKKYKNIFENLLGRVLIAKNLNDAIAISKKFKYKFKIVTLDGDVINAGGSMTGGSIYRRNISILGRDREMKDLNSKKQELEKKIEVSDIKRKEFGFKYDELIKEEELLRSDIHKTGLNIVRIKEQIQNISELVNDNSLTIKKNLEERDTLKVKKNEVLSSITNKQEKLMLLEDEKIKLDSFLSVEDSDLRDKNLRIDELKESITNLRIELASLSRDIYNLSDTLNRIDSEKKSISSEVQTRNDLIEKNKIQYKKLIHDLDELENDVKSIDESTSEKNEVISLKESEKKDLQSKNLILLEELNSLSGDKEKLYEDQRDLELRISRIDVELKNMRDNIWYNYEMSYGEAKKYENFDINLTKIKNKIQIIRKNISSLGHVNINAIEDYKEVKERFDYLNSQKNDLIKAKDDLYNIIKDIIATMEIQFEKEFSDIRKLFKETFKKLFGGGKADLILLDEKDILNSGIEIIAQPPGKKLQNISLLSGGEKALTAIAILFAILEHKPTPFSVLDEIEAALDESNVNNFANHLKDFSKRTQFIMITHRRGTMENSDVLYGVTMEEKGVSRIISLKLDDEIAV